MVAYSTIQDDDLHAAREAALSNGFVTGTTVRCTGPAMFRTKAARDLACLFDVDPDLNSWQCLPLVLRSGPQIHVPDFKVDRGGIIGLADSSRPPDWVHRAAGDAGYRYEVTEITNSALAIRLRNAKDLMRYAGHQVALGDRIRILDFLDEHGPMPISACVQLVQHSRDGIGVIAALCLDQILRIELDDSPIGPETRVHRAK